MIVWAAQARQTRSTKEKSLRFMESIGLERDPPSRTPVWGGVQAVARHAASLGPIPLSWNRPSSWMGSIFGGEPEPLRLKNAPRPVQGRGARGERATVHPRSLEHRTQKWEPVLCEK